MIKAVAIDDEPLALKIIETFCASSNLVELEKTFSSPNEGLRYINKFPVQLAFLDIQMPSITGTDLAKKIRPEVMVIFTTAYDNFALEGYNLNAIDYLLKPFTQERFNMAVQKAITYSQGALKSENTSLAGITVRADYSLVKIQLNSIKYIEGLDDYVKIHLVNAKIIVTRLTMKSILDMLPADEFIRVQRSYIVPLKAITSVKSRFVCLGDIEIPIGQSYGENLISRFKLTF